MTSIVNSYAIIICSKFKSKFKLLRPKYFIDNHKEVDPNEILNNIK